VEFTVNLMEAEADVAQWSRRRESQGWHQLSVADHFFTQRPFPHVWVTAATMAAATTTVAITTAFVNNLFRSPVEVAQAALMLQHTSGGRFELGLGAGWARDEAVKSGLAYPEPRDRAGAFAESAEIIASLLGTGACTLSGDYYTVDVDTLGPLSDTTVPLVCAVGGPRTIREVTPHADRVELKAASPATRGGALDMAALAAIDDQHIIDLIARVRSVDPAIGIGMFVLCNVGDDERTRQIAAMMGDAGYGRFFGDVAKVADGIAWLESIGVSRAQLSPFDDTSLDRLAPALL